MPDYVKDVHVWRLNAVFSIKIVKNLKRILVTSTFDVNVFTFHMNFGMHRSFSFSGVTPVLSLGGYTPWWFSV